MFVGKSAEEQELAGEEVGSMFSDLIARARAAGTAPGGAPPPPPPPSSGGGGVWAAIKRMQAQGVPKQSILDWVRNRGKGKWVNTARKSAFRHNF